jgi:hypothetical protein
MNLWTLYSRQVKRDIMDNLNACVFQYRNEPYELEFERILTGITACYKMMIKDNVVVPSNDENKIRDVLLMNYLKKKAIRKRVNLTDYRFDREIPEDCTKGRVDIRIISRNDFEIDEAYYIIECKRLNNRSLTGKTGLNAEYIKNGILRFIKRQYSAYYSVNGMIGFVVEEINIDNNIKSINGLLINNFKDANTQKKLTHVGFIKKFKHSYYSIHHVIENKKIKLYHLMFDLSKNIKDDN